MANSKNIIYPEKTETSVQSKKTALAALFILLVILLTLAVILWWRAAREEAPTPLPPPQGDTSIQAGFFTVSQNPGRVAIPAGDVKPIEVKIVVLPLEGFAQSVAFAVDDILKEGRSVKGEGTLKAAFSPSRIEPENFEKGTVLTLTPTAEIGPGVYVVNYRAQSESVKKNFRIMVTVQ